MVEHKDLELKEKPYGFGVASFVLGILSVIGFIMPYFSIILAILGLIFGIVQVKEIVLD